MATTISMSASVAGSPLIGMTLTNIRSWFKEVTGRGDLVNEDGTDNGADKYINSGGRLLDTLYNHPKRSMRYIGTLAQGGFSLSIPLCRSIKEVWIADSDGARTQLKKKSLQDMRANYAKDWADIDKSVPKFYSPNIVGLGPTQVDSSASAFSSNNDVSDLVLPTRGNFEYNSILMMPPANEIYTINVFGDFSQVELEVDTDTNYWSVLYPYMLVISSKFVLECGFYPEQARVVLANVDPVLRGIDHDIVDEEISELDQMEG